MNTPITLIAVALAATLGLEQGSASIKTKTASLSGEIQGIVVAKRQLQGGAFDLAVIDGRAIRSIDERGIVTTKGAWQTITPVEGIAMPPEGRIAERMVSRQVDQNPSEPLAFRVLGELPMDTAGNATGDIIPKLRLKTATGERLISVADLVPISASRS